VEPFEKSFIVGVNSQRILKKAKGMDLFSLLHNSGCKNEKWSNREASGGIRLLLTRDLYKLPSVTKRYEWTFITRALNAKHIMQVQNVKSTKVKLL
jgi:hypothetical protein